MFLWIYLGAYRERPGFPLEQIMRSLKQLESAAGNTISARGSF